MKPMPPEVKTNQQLMREYIQRERRVELFYEGKRPWTCRLYQMCIRDSSSCRYTFAGCGANGKNGKGADHTKP